MATTLRIKKEEENKKRKKSSPPPNTVRNTRVQFSIPLARGKGFPLRFWVPTTWLPVLLLPQHCHFETGAGLREGQEMEKEKEKERRESLHTHQRAEDLFSGSLARERVFFLEFPTVHISCTVLGLGPLLGENLEINENICFWPLFMF